MTLFEYGTTFSIRKAEYYLLKTDLSISEIIAQLKFTNKSHFYKLFYAKHHMSPKEFRSKLPQRLSLSYVDPYSLSSIGI